MQKPKVFISSTIYDFKDLRSALKYWLEDGGYSVQMSECTDFDKDSSLNSYNACLDVIPDCDYFILLIGSRVGNMYNDSISITRKEYQTAYEFAKRGKIIKIITFLRQSISDILEDRKSLVEYLKNMIILEHSNPIDSNSLAYYDSKLIQGALHIQSFVNEVARKFEFKADQKPGFNWINIFNDFSDIIDVLKIELRLDINIEKQIAEQNITTALIRNLKALSWKSKDDKTCYSFSGFKNIRNQMFF